MGLDHKKEPSWWVIWAMLGLEPPTNRHNSLLGAEHHFLVHFRAEAAVQAAALHLFPKQHSDPFLSSHIIHHTGGNFHCYFHEKQGGDQKQRDGACAQI